MYTICVKIHMDKRKREINLTGHIMHTACCFIYPFSVWSSQSTAPTSLLPITIY